MPLLLIVVLTLSWYYASEYLSELVKWGSYLVYVALFVVLAVTCHRLVLLDSQGLAFRYKISWSSRETRFFIWALGVGCIFVVLVAVLAGFVLNALVGQWISDPNSIWPKLVLFAAKVPAFYVCARCSPVFPAIAVNRQVNLKWAWNLSKNNGWRLVVLVAVLPWFTSHALDLFYRDEATVIETVLLTFLGFAFYAFDITALSLAYRELIKNEGNDVLDPNLPLEPDEHNRHLT